MINGTYAGSGSVGGTSACGICAGLLTVGQPHACGGTPPELRFSTWPVPPMPTPLYTVQCCPVCRGRGSHPGGFYGFSGGLNPDECRTCDGKGILKVSMLGGVEKVT